MARKGTPGDADRNEWQAEETRQVETGVKEAAHPWTHLLGPSELKIPK